MLTSNLILFVIVLHQQKSFEMLQKKTIYLQSTFAIKNDLIIVFSTFTTLCLLLEYMAIIKMQVQKGNKN